jgi:hypothetical protein
MPKTDISQLQRGTSKRTATVSIGFCALLCVAVLCSIAIVGRVGEWRHTKVEVNPAEKWIAGLHGVLVHLGGRDAAMEKATAPLLSITTLLSDSILHGATDAYRGYNDNEFAAGLSKRQGGGILDIFKPITDAISGAIGAIGNSILGDLQVPLLFLGIGTGTGAVQGLNLTTVERSKQVAQKVASDNGADASGINLGVQNLGMGLAASILGAINISSLIQPNPDTLPLVATALGEGIGNGAAAGFHINSNLKPPNDSTISGLVGTLAFGLTKSISSNINISRLMPRDSSGNLMKILPVAATGLGKGLGKGVSIGLELQDDTPVPIQTMPDGSPDFGGIAEGFAQALTSGILGNGTIKKLMSGLGNSQGSGFSLPGGSSPNLGLVAQGIARGLLQGAGDALQSIGGVQAFMDNSAVIPVGGLPNVTLQFDDSVGGTASGFGMGLGGQGVLVGYMIYNNMTGPKRVARSIAVATEIRTDISVIKSRQAESTGQAQGLNLSAIVNADTVSTGLQMGVDALTCQGVGGLLLVLQGLMSSGILSISSPGGSENITATIKQVIPVGIMSFSNDGNTYEIDGQKISDSLGRRSGISADSLIINGHPGSRFLAFFIIHGKCPCLDIHVIRNAFF